MEDNTPKTPQQMAPASAYFTKEIEDAIREMSEQEMLRELLNLEETRAWIAILKYNQLRMSSAQAAIFSGDPVKEPTNIARNQGVLLGICDLQNAIIISKMQREEKDEGSEGSQE